MTSSRARSDYKGVTFGARKRMSNHFQMEANYVYSRDYDNDSNERDPFNDFSGPTPNCLSTHTEADCFPFNLDWSPSNRDIRHRFNAFATGDLPWGFQGNLRFQVHSAQPTQRREPRLLHVISDAKTTLIPPRIGVSLVRSNSTIASN